MSNFGALIYFDGQPVSRRDIERMSQALITNRKYQPRIRIYGSIAVVHSLNPFCPEDLHERQPYSDQDLRYIFLADARLDNREELLKEFEIDQKIAPEIADGKLIVEAFKRWGRKTPEKIYGDYAFLVWDNLEKTIFGACDPMGFRTMLYFWKPPFLALSTILRGLHALPQIPKNTDRNSMIDYLALRPLKIGKTLYEEIERVPAGYTLSASAKSRQINRHWYLDGRNEIRLSDDKAYREAFMDLFTRAVRSRLRAIGPVGISMSGGLDSSSVGALAAAELAEKNQMLTAFTLVHRRTFDPGVIPERIDPEYAYVEEMCKRYTNIRPIYLPGKNQKILDELEADFESAGIMPHSIVFQRRHRTMFPEVQSRGIRVLLNGYNGNTSMSYSGSDSIFPLFFKGFWKKAFQGIRALQPLSRRSFRQLFFNLIIRPFYPETLDFLINSVFPDKRTHVRKTFGIKASDYRNSDGKFSLNAIKDYFGELLTRMDPNFARKRMFIDGINNNIGDLWNTTRATWQIEERDPTSDQKLVEFCLSIPMDQYLRKGSNRFLLRNAMKNILPETIVNRTSVGVREPDLAERFNEVQEDILVRFQKIRDRNLLSFLDYDQLQKMLSIPDSNLRKDSLESARYAMRAVTMGEFTEWLSGSND
ncbi:MAG: hypothetical protein HQM10_26880 [Candidatus Riflebacteria bacterium]|nr:hypothetical protein [Candidatus Riflebacteria bacterium]